jgi:transcriptional regulator with XRE-family HTH domain
LKLDGERVRGRRERLALSMEDASARARVSPHTWVRAEHGDEVRPSSIRRIADALGVDPAQLMVEEEEAALPKAPAPSPEERTAQYLVSAEDLARLFRYLARRGQRIVERSVREGASEELSREATDYHEEAATLLRVRGGRDIRGKGPDELAEAVEDYEEVEARIQNLISQDVFADEAERAESQRFKRNAGGNYTEQRGADAS